MSAITQFHLAFPVRDLDEARHFYGELIGCPQGRSDVSYQDFDFFGHHLVAHIAPDGKPLQVGRFDGEAVPIPHFGMNLDRRAWETLARRLTDAGIKFEEEPHLRLKGKPGQHVTMFFFDPSGNALEFKSFDDPEQTFIP
ncbi:glyoxalase [Lysobacter sp. Root667]|uniref:VOC family protein n=1 Tax=Lysobacter sp. Root667 TaxID=1736581 RepID=UPI0006FD4A48|nr:VOC family protein [Lysobacter sp. Root667]KRA73110.1 glyoxalase [Lysobacter sp. Root667]